jgi:hypothetical protein
MNRFFVGLCVGFALALPVGALAQGGAGTTPLLIRGFADVRLSAIDGNGVRIDKAGLALDFVDAELLHVIVIPAVNIGDIGFAFCDQFRQSKLFLVKS